MGLFGKKKDDGTEQLKRAIVDTAFDQLLVRGTDYTVASEVNGVVLVKKEVKWAYFYSNNGVVINAMFSIRTDKDTFVFQVKGEDIMRIPADLALTMYKFR